MTTYWTYRVTMENKDGERIEELVEANCAKAATHIGRWRREEGIVKVIKYVNLGKAFETPIR